MLKLEKNILNTLKMKDHFKIYTLREFKDFLRKNHLYSEDAEYGEELWKAIEGEEIILDFKQTNQNYAELVVRFKMKGYNY